MEITGIVENWQVQDCGSNFKIGDKLEDVQLESWKPVIYDSSVKRKILKQIFLNRYCFIGQISRLHIVEKESKTHVINIMVDCGIPIRLNYGGDDVFCTLEDWGYVCSLKPKVGKWIAGECNINLVTCASGEFIGQCVSTTITKIHKLVKDTDKNFGTILEIDSVDQTNIKYDDIYLSLNIKKILKPWDDIKGRISGILE